MDIVVCWNNYSFCEDCFLSKIDKIARENLF